MRVSTVFAMGGDYGHGCGHGGNYGGYGYYQDYGRGSYNYYQGYGNYYQGNYGYGYSGGPLGFLSNG